MGHPALRELGSAEAALARSSTQHALPEGSGLRSSQRHKVGVMGRGVGCLPHQREFIDRFSDLFGFTDF